MLCILYNVNGVYFADVYSKWKMSNEIVTQLADEIASDFVTSKKRSAHIALTEIKMTDENRKSDKYLRYRGIRCEIMPDIEEFFSPIPSFVINSKTLDLVKYFLDNPNIVVDQCIQVHDIIDDDECIQKPVSNTSSVIVEEYSWWLNVKTNQGWFTSQNSTRYGRYVVLHERYCNADGDDLLTGERIHINRIVWIREKRLYNNDWKYEIMNVQL